LGFKKKGGFGLKKAIGLFKLAKSSLPKVIANDAKNHFLLGFRQGGGQTDASKGGWQKRKKDPKGARRGILILRGRMMKALKTVSATFSKIEIAIIGIAYAQRHNEGLDGMPKREILGKSSVLDAKTKRTIERELRKIFR